MDWNFTEILLKLEFIRISPKLCLIESFRLVYPKNEIKVHLALKSCAMVKILGILKMAMLVHVEHEIIYVFAYVHLPAILCLKDSLPLATSII